MRTFFYIILIVLGLLIIGEAAAWIWDAQYAFREKLLQALDTVEPNMDPISAHEELPWNGKGLIVRNHKEKSSCRTKVISVLGERREDIHYCADGRRIYDNEINSDDRKKIFIVGGSAAFGFGSYYKESFGYLLEQRLGVDEFVVFNSARLALTSGQLVPVVKVIVDFYDPYAIIIFMGNNEWIHWTAATQYSISKDDLTWYRLLAQSRLAAGLLYQRIKSLQSRKPQRQNSQEKYLPFYNLEGFEYALAHPGDDFLKEDKTRWLDIKNNFLNTFENNLKIMVNYCKAHNARVILSTVPFKYKLSVAWKEPQPQSMAPQHRDAVYDSIDLANDLIARGDYQAALENLEKALKLDPLVPVLHYMKAFCLEKRGRMLDAEEAYAQARENMIGNLGSVRSINQRIRKVAKDERIDLLDIKGIFDDRSHARGEFFNEHLILDDCHPTPLGHHYIAASLEGKIKQMK